MSDPGRIALSIFLAVTALVVVLLLPPHPAIWAPALLLAMVAVLICPSPP